MARDVRYEDIDLQALFLSEPATVAGLAAGGATTAGLIGLGGIGVYRLFSPFRSSVADRRPVSTTEPGLTPALYF